MGMIYSDFQAFFRVEFEAFGPEEELLQQICENVEAFLFVLRLLQKLEEYGWKIGLRRGSCCSILPFAAIFTTSGSSSTEPEQLRH
ncbi:MAG: hypothetical protein PUE50_07390 [Firmicutes bacterium]|nr:hypothetical protein [Bacillota bacterium]